MSIEEKHALEMGFISSLLGEVFEGYGFALLVFDLKTHDGKMNYISNAKRADMICALKELANVLEIGQPEYPTTRQ